MDVSGTPAFASRSIIVAADVKAPHLLEELMHDVSDVEDISGIKLGFSLAFKDLSRSVQIVERASRKRQTRLRIIYDHQKGGNDIPDTGKEFAEQLRDAGVDAAILFPFAGPETQKGWTRACLDAGLDVIVGGIMTHGKFLVSEGGYIADEAVNRIYNLACEMGVTELVVPGTKLNWVERIRMWVESRIGTGNFTLHAPGFIAQPGNIAEFAKVAGNRWTAIIGRGIYSKPAGSERRKAAIAIAEQVMAPLQPGRCVVENV